MIIVKNNKTEFKLNVEGYSYPFSREYWDSNWLSINIEIKDFQTSLFFDKNDNCLLTTELVNLREWFSNLKNNNFDETDEIHFMEPALSIKFKNNELEIVLRYKLNPKYEKDFDSEYSLFFVVNEKEIQGIIAELDRYIKKYPEKEI